MKKELLKNYINKLTKQDIITYLSKECIPFSKEEIDIIYNSIKNDTDELLNDNPINYIERHNISLNNELYKTIIEKYNEYKKFIECDVNPI